MWTIEFVNGLAKAEIDALTADLRARFTRIGELVLAHGLERVGAPYLKHVEGKL